MCPVLHGLTLLCPQVQLQEVPLVFLISSQSKRVQCAHSAAEKPFKERREPAAAHHQSSVLGCVSAPRCRCVCRCRCVSLSLSLHLSAAFLRWTRLSPPITARQQLWSQRWQKSWRRRDEPLDSEKLNPEKLQQEFKISPEKGKRFLSLYWRCWTVRKMCPIIKSEWE